MSNKQLLQSAGDGTAVPAGYVGELKEATNTTTVVLSGAAGTYTDITSMSLSLEPGIWELQTDISLYISGASGITTNGRVGAVVLTDNSNNIQRGVVTGFANATTPNVISQCSIKHRIVVSSTTTYKLRATTFENNAATTNPTYVAVLASYGPNPQPIYFRALRIA